jgi:rRNA-processing protein FCF1
MTDTKILVPDTNVLIHCKILNEVEIHSEIDSVITQVVVPLAIVDELDKLKNSPINRIARRASRLIQLLEAAAFDAFEVRPGIPLVVAPDAPDRDRIAWVDDEVISRCLELSDGGHVRVVLLSNDLGMRVRAHHRFRDLPALEVVKPPESMCVRERDPQEEEIAQLRAELENRSKAGVEAIVNFDGKPFMQAPPFRLVKHPGVDELVRRRIASAPAWKPPAVKSAPLIAAATFAGPSEGQIRAYARDREQWDADYRSWIVHRIERIELGEAAVWLRKLQVVNVGGATAEDVEMRLTLPSDSGLSFVICTSIGVDGVAHEPMPPNPPRSLYEPKLGSIASIDYSNLDYDTPRWTISGREAVYHFDQLRPHARPYLFEEHLCVIPENGTEPITKGFPIQWELLASRPDYKNAGTLHVKPRMKPELYVGTEGEGPNS